MSITKKKCRFKHSLKELQSTSGRLRYKISFCRPKIKVDQESIEKSIQSRTKFSPFSKELESNLGRLRVKLSFSRSEIEVDSNKYEKFICDYLSLTKKKKNSEKQLILSSRPLEIDADLKFIRKKKRKRFRADVSNLPLSVVDLP